MAASWRHSPLQVERLVEVGGLDMRKRLTHARLNPAETVVGLLLLLLGALPRHVYKHSHALYTQAGLRLLSMLWGGAGRTVGQRRPFSSVRAVLLVAAQQLG